MSSSVVPLARRTAYQRWELDTFDDAKQAPGAAASAEARLQAVSEQADQLRRQAHAGGFAAGRQEGREQAAEELSRLQSIVAALTEEARRFDQSIADELLGLAMAVSKQVMRQTLKLHPEAILAVLADVLGQSPLSRDHSRLMLHPQDVALVRASLGERLAQSGCEIVESTQISPGGCRLQAPDCDIDATLERRWKRVAMALGHEHAWIE